MTLTYPKPEEPQRVRDGRAALADRRANSSCVSAVLVDQMRKAGRLLERIEILALQVLDMATSSASRRRWRDDRRNRRQAQSERRRASAARRRSVRSRRRGGAR